jgi:hypothetical protein
MKITLRSWPVVFLSYDEPNRDQNWARVQELLPDSLRVHGVKGSDRAHKACALEAGDCDRFWTIDGDNWLLRDAVSYEAWLPEEFERGTEIYSHCSRNPVTGLIYGNGGVKLWSRRVVETMQTHEAADRPESAIDFCWQLDYVLMPQVLSETRSAETAQQAWRSAFRESCKLAQINGSASSHPDQWRDRQAEINVHRLAAWLMVGADHPQGLWSILGSRQALTWLWRDQGDHELIQDFDFLDDLWDRLAPRDPDQVMKVLQREGLWLEQQGLPVKQDCLTPSHSRWYKQQLVRDLRQQPRRLR